MADDINPGLRVKLLAALAALEPAIRGEPNVSPNSVSAPLIAAREQQLAVMVRRQQLIQAVLDQLDVSVSSLATLEADGYPAPVSPATLSVALFTELQGNQSDSDAAAAMFIEQQAVTADLAKATHTPQEIPPVG